MREFDELCEIMARLRAEDGCPWDREQTHESLRPYFLEETYEALEAIDSQDPKKLCSELGDVLLQIVFHAQIADEQGQYDMRAVLARINEKLRYRHPHVFSDVTVSDSDEVVDNWEQLKLLEPEAAHRTSALDGVPDILPALKRAFALQKKASKVGFDWPDVEGPRGKVREEEAELEEALASGDRDRVADEFGDLLFALVNVARFYKLDPEDALRRTCDRFAGRFTRVESQAGEMGRDLRDMDIAELDVLWEKAKEEG